MASDLGFPPHPLMTVDLAALHARRVRPNPVKSLNHLLDLRAETHPHNVAVGFPEPGEGGSWEKEVFDFRRLKTCADAAARYYSSRLSDAVHPDSEAAPIVGLLCPSGPEFLLTVFGCIRLGLGVLLLAPQLPSAAVAHLLKKTSSTHLLVDGSLRKLAHDALKEAPEVSLLEVIPRQVWKSPPGPTLDQGTDAESHRIAIVLHSSGSSGLPKPIPIPHRLLTSTMPFAPSSPPRSSFSTTPLFHGGITDLARALAAVEPIWFFPLHKAPVTADTVLRAVEASGDISWFFSVPYILEMLADRKEGLAMLQRMGIVSTGGAPLGEEVGKKLVDAGVRLVSRYGSSECGFLMTSHRDYEKDKEWSWLREPDTPVARHRIFQPSAEGKRELILTKDWPHITLTNRSDGGYATGDLFSRHPSIPRAWRYAGRADDIIVMLNGEKTDPAPIEEALTSSPYISSAVVFGSSRATCGALVRLSSPGPSHGTTDPTERIRSAVEAANRIAPLHSRLAFELIITVPPGGDWPSSSKGLVQRGRALQLYHNEIERAYEAYEGGQGSARGEAEVHRLVREAVIETIQDTKVDDHDDLFAMGVNSVQATRIRSLLTKSVHIPHGQKLSTTVVFDQPSIKRLVKHLLQLQAGEPGVSDASEEIALMRRLVEKYGHFETPPRLSNGVHSQHAKADCILLTGATGSLGAHILHNLLRIRPVPPKVVCLCRASSDEEALGRIDESLRRRGLPPLGATDRSRLTCLAARLGDSYLGLGEPRWRQLALDVTSIIHGAWAVNFIARLSSFEKDHIRGLHHLLTLATFWPNSPPSFIFLSSGASVTSSRESPILENPSIEPADAAPLGYGRSKWVAEGICRRAGEQLPGPVSIIRVGQICGDQAKGIWNDSEYWPLIVCSAKSTGCLPLIDDHPSWIPIDVCAAAIVDISEADRSARKGLGVFHVCNRHTSVSWEHILEVLRSKAGIPAKAVTPAEWLRKIEQSAQAGADISRGLLSMWRQQFEAAQPPAPVVLDICRAEKESASLRACGPISDELVVKLATHWK